MINEGKRNLEWMAEEGDGHQLQFPDQRQHERMYLIPLTSLFQVSFYVERVKGKWSNYYETMGKIVQSEGWSMAATEFCG